MLIDTHAHLWWDTYTDDLDEVVSRATAGGVTKMIAPGTDLITSQKAIDLAKKYPGVIYAAVGIHPEETVDPSLAVTKNALMFNSQIRKLREMVEHNRGSIVAIGEIGTDTHTDDLKKSMPQQKELFREQLEIAHDFDLPVIVHTRTSLPETLAVLDYMKVMPRGQFHCFSYDAAGLTEVLNRGFYVSFCGNITWSKRVLKLVPLVPADRLLTETDSPLMVPRDTQNTPAGGNLRNEPINVTILAQLQAETRGETITQFGEQTTKNAVTLYTL